MEAAGGGLARALGAALAAQAAHPARLLLAALLGPLMLWLALAALPRAAGVSILGRPKISAGPAAPAARLARSAATAAAALAQARWLQAGLRARHGQEAFVDECLATSGNRLRMYQLPCTRAFAEALRSLPPYVPPWFYNRHLMTLLPINRGPTRPVRFRRNILRTAVRHHGASHLVEAAVDWVARDPDAPAATAVMFVVPGLGGSSSQSLYAEIADELTRAFPSLDLCILHDRGEGGHKLTNHVHHHKMDPTLLRALVRQTVKHRGTDTKYLGLGLSQGGALLLRYMQEEADDCVFAAAMTIGSCFNYPVGIHQLESTCGLVGSVYSFGLAMHHQSRLKANRDNLGKAGVDIAHALKLNSLLDLDEALATSVYGHSGGLREYHAEFNLGDRAGGLRTPVLCLHAMDDPLFSDDAHRVQRELAASMDHVIFLEVPLGGHLSFRQAQQAAQYGMHAATAFFSQAIPLCQSAA